MIGSYRPCGVCTALVPYPEGCEHWRPARPSRVKPSGAQRRSRAVSVKQSREAATEFARQMGLST